MPPHSALLSHLYRLTSPPLDDAELLRRWVQRRDEDAFAALVTRHGRMVQGVCRRVLGNRQDAEDAFQAAFLILARKAAAIRHPEALPGWLHGVAVRLAYKARAVAARRRCPGADSSVCEPRDPHLDPLDALSARELLALIDREIARLPEVYRLPLVLCDLEERTQAEAARLLGWTLGSLRGRLLRGRERLRARLARRGIAPAVLAAVFAQGTADAAALTASVTRLAVRFSTCPTSAEVSPSVATLVREGIRGMMLTKLKIVSVVILAVSTFVAGAGLLAWPNPSPVPPQVEQKANNKLPSAPSRAKPQVRRDQAGDPLPAEALSRLGTIRFRHGELIQYLAFGPDGKTLVSHGGGSGIRFWDVSTGKEIQRFLEQANAQSIALSPNGKLLAIRLITNNPKDKAIAIREFETGRLLRSFGDARARGDLLFSPDGKLLAAFSGQNDMELWNPASDRRLHTLKGHKDIIWSLAFSADGKTLVSSSDDKTIRFWDTATGKELRQIKHNQGIAEIALSPDGKFLASIDAIKHTSQNATLWTNDHRVRLWDASTGKELRQVTMSAKEMAPKLLGGFFNLGFAPGGKTLLAGSVDGVLHFWNPETGTEVRQIPGFTGSPAPFAFAPDGKTIAMADGFSTILRVFDFASGKDVVPTFGHRSSVSSISFTPGKQRVVTASQDGTIRFWEPATGQEWHRRSVARDGFYPPQLRRDGRTYLTFGADKLYRLHDLSNGEEQTTLRGHDSKSYIFTLSPDRNTLASTNADKAVRLLNPETGQVRHILFTAKEEVSGMAFTPDGRNLVVWTDERIVTMWDVATGRKRRQFIGPSWGGAHPPASKPLPYTAVLSPDGRLLAFGLQGDNRNPSLLPVFDTTTGKEVRRFTPMADGACILAFSPDSKSLAWVGWSNATVYLGEIASGREQRRFMGHSGRVISLAFSANGKMLISGSDDTTALVWDLTGRLTMGEKLDKALSAEELAGHWKTLAGDDAAAAYRAVQMLAADPARSVPYLRTHLHPVAPADEKRLQQWIADLDSDQFAVRQKAMAELEKLGSAALHAMRKALEEKPALEMRRRLEQLIEKQERAEWSRSGEGLRTWRALEVLERVGTVEAKDVLMLLANGAPGARQTQEAKTALQRLAQRSDGRR
ncbi:MAG TPA: sigma-70 family RNA polymerase sigma factor [Gemmataceae bacterium]|nr:sigma-70 family RNA polymerase sigma factor [Gemmataceae bacterium]